MYFAERLRILVHQGANAACLRSREVLRHDPAGGENDWIFGIRLFGSRFPLHWLKVCLAVRVREISAFVKPRCAGMFRRRTGPEHALLAVDSLPANAVIVGDSAL